MIEMVNSGGPRVVVFLHMIYDTDWYKQTADVPTPLNCATRSLFQRYATTVFEYEPKELYIK